MFDLTDTSIQLQGSALLLLVLAIFATALSVFVYRTTNPIVSKRLRIFLLSLRLVALFLLILMLFAPVLSINYSEVKEPLVAVLADNSTSLQIQDESAPRSEVLRQVLIGDDLREATSQNEAAFYRFSNALTPFDPDGGDTLAFSGVGTNIAYALEAAARIHEPDNLVALVLLSDGGHNLGENPVRVAERLGRPVFVVGIGSPVVHKDIRIAGITTNRIAYANDRLPVDVTISSTGFEGQRIPVRILEKGREVTRVQIRPSESEAEANLRLWMEPTLPGMHHYEVRIPVLKDELTGANNRRSFHLKVLKDKMRVLLVSGGPGPDFGALRRTLERDKNIELMYAVEKSGTRFYKHGTLPKTAAAGHLDCIILLDYPHRDSNKREFGALVEKLEKEKVPLLIVLGRGISFSNLQAIGDLLPFRFRGSLGPEVLAPGSLASAGMDHPVTRLKQNAQENERVWQDLPPVYHPMRTFAVPGNARTLVSVDAPNSRARNHSAIEPLITVASIGERKAAAILGHSIYRWDLLPHGVTGGESHFPTLIGNLVRWLTTKEEGRHFTVWPGKEIFTNGEAVTIYAQLYDETYRPLDGAAVRAEITGELDSYALDLEPTGSGRYQGRVPAIQPGEFTVKARARLDDRSLGTATAAFSVEETNIEFQQTRMDELLLRRIARASGGRYVPPDSVAALRQYLSFSATLEEKHREFEIWNRYPLLILLVCLLCAEWFVRKRRGMM